MTHVKEVKTKIAELLGYCDKETSCIGRERSACFDCSGFVITPTGQVPPTPTLFFKIGLALLGPLVFSLYFSIRFPSSVKSFDGIFFFLGEATFG